MFFFVHRVNDHNNVHATDGPLLSYWLFRLYRFFNRLVYALGTNHRISSILNYVEAVVGPIFPSMVKTKELTFWE